MMAAGYNAPSTMYQSTVQREDGSGCGADDSYKSDNNDGIVCWFCKKGRHSECMTKIPVSKKGDGPHDCTFDVAMMACTCSACTHKKK